MENLGIDFKIMIAQAINFVLFFIIVKKFIAKPFNSFLEDEHDKEREKQRLLESAKKIEEDLKVKEQKMKAQAQKEMKDIIEETKKNSQDLRETLLDEAKKEAEEIKEKMRGQLNEEKEDLYKEVKKKVAELSFDIVNKGLKDSLDEETQKRITQRILKNLN
ncbi:F0F1 ATP synthase subunit B [Candidatus Roizmanbacteria bacterium]|nr:F0F1 ATP synthase subunit B [Candidatus Roizmanbacteria bacterium]